MRIVVVGAGINGLVAANYLRRGGHHVTLLERGPKVGGACVSATMTYRGKQIVYALRLNGRSRCRAACLSDVPRRDRELRASLDDQAGRL
jgi:glycine/D-amino acid oxidase-like deaminating enzyme